MTVGEETWERHMASFPSTFSITMPSNTTSPTLPRMQRDTPELHRFNRTDPRQNMGARFLPAGHDPANRKSSQETPQSRGVEVRVTQSECGMSTSFATTVYMRWATHRRVDQDRLTCGNCPCRQPQVASCRLIESVRVVEEDVYPSGRPVASR